MTTEDAAPSPATDWLAQAVATFEATFSEVDDSPQFTNDSFSPSGVVYERFVIPAEGQGASKNPKPATFETVEEAATAWLAAVQKKFGGRSKLWWRARPRVIQTGNGGMTIYCSIATGD